MKEHEREQFLISIGENIDRSNTFLDSPIIITKKKETIKINTKEIILTPNPLNSINLKNSLDNAEKNYVGIIKYKDSDIPKDYYEKCIKNFTKYIKDIINMCFYDLKFDENNMNLIYVLALKNMEYLNNSIADTNNSYNEKLDKIETKYNELIKNRQNQAIIDSLNAPKTVTSYSYDGLFGDKIVNSYIGTSKKIDGSGFNSFDLLDKNYDNNKAAEDTINNIYNRCITIVKKFNEQLFNLIVVKKSDVFKEEKDNYFDYNFWIELIKIARKDEYKNINKCLDFYSIDIAKYIKKLIIENATNEKTLDENLINFYEDSFCKIDVSKELISTLTENIISEINKEKDIKSKEKIANKSFETLTNIPYLNNDSANTIIKNVNNVLNDYKESISDKKKLKNKKRIKKSILIISIILIILILIYFAYKYINEIVNFLPLLFTILILFFIISCKFKILKKIISFFRGY